MKNSGCLLLLLFTSISFAPSYSEPNYLNNFLKPINAFSYGIQLLYLNNVTNTTECAKKCLYLGDGSICNAFDYNKNTLECDLSSSLKSSEYKLKPSNDYKFYKRYNPTKMYVYDDMKRCMKYSKCNCDHLNNYKHMWIISNKCTHCICVKKNYNICNRNNKCICNGDEILIHKRDINGCNYCSCEKNELDMNVHNVSYNHYHIPIIKINSGGTSYINKKGDIWKRDTGYNGGFTYKLKNNNNISNINISNINYIYKSARWGRSYPKDLEYHLQIEYIGHYSVKLHFSNIYSDNLVNTTNNTVFNIYLEDKKVRENYNLTKECGGTGFCSYEHILYTDDDLIDIKLEKVLNEPIINGIEIFYLLPFNNSIIYDKICHQEECECSDNQDILNYIDENNCNNCICVEKHHDDLDIDETIEPVKDDEDLVTNERPEKSGSIQDDKYSNIITTSIILGVIVLLLIITVIVMYIKKERNIDNEDNNVEITASFDNPMFKAVETVHYEETTH